MREVELKSVVPDLPAARRRIEAAGATLVFAGYLEDRRYDTGDRRLAARDRVLRLRVYRAEAAADDAHGAPPPRAYVDWKGPARLDGGYKVREELSTAVGDPCVLAEMLERLGYVVTRETDREIAQYDLGGTTIRFERYPHMDVLVEVEGEPEGIERAIAALELPRAGFTADRLLTFVARFQARTGQRAVLCGAGSADDRRFLAADDA